MSIYTRTGDTGTTALFGGKRVLKCEELVDVYGSIDELNSWVGVIAARITTPEIQKFLYTIQSDLFTIGSVLAGWNGKLGELETRVKEMETRIDIMEKDLPPLTNFILPGGSPLGAYTHIARSICRRVERQVVKLATQAMPATPARPEISDDNMKMIIKYLNRLSDLFFMLARFINKNANAPEISWIGISRKQKNT